MNNAYTSKKKLRQCRIPRIMYLKMHYGSDFIDRIKDDYCLEEFLQEQLKAERKIKNQNRTFFNTREAVKDFAVQWFIFTDYYKRRFGQDMKDADAVKRLSNEKEFTKVQNLYDFRCRLFKSDFSPEKDFSYELKKRLKYLKGLNGLILKKLIKRDQYLLKNTEW